MVFKNNGDIYAFESVPFWKAMRISSEIPKRRFTELFGAEKRNMETPEDAIEFLCPLVEQYQEKLYEYIKKYNSSEVIKNLYRILDECYQYYICQKKARIKLRDIGVRDVEIYNEYGDNRNIAMNTLSAVNLWIENSLLYQENIEVGYDEDNIELDPILLVDLYVYGLISRSLSLLRMNVNINGHRLFTGLEINLDNAEPLTLLRYHPVVYYNPIIAGNQDVFRVSADEIKNCSKSPFGTAFYEEFGVDFATSLGLILNFQKYILDDGKYAFTVIDRSDFLGIIREYSNENVDPKKFFDTFVLTKEKVQGQLKTNKKGQVDPIIWMMGTNRYRHELCPFACLADNKVIMSYAALGQAANIWHSFYANGGMMYTNQKDRVTRAIGERNEELSNRLVDQLLEILNKNYTAGFSEKDVKYKRIFGSKEYNYGDYDVVFYAKDINELFLIEAKFFSDSLNNSGYLTDYKKLYDKNGYYEHCRKRYELVLQEPEKMKKFINAKGNLKVHFLFVSSKPLEIDFMDSDGIVAFPCLSIFEDYINGKLISEDGKETIRPVHII